MDLPPFLSRRMGVVGAALALLTGCSGSRVLDALTPQDSYDARLGLAYGPDPRHRLDAYLPLAPRGPTPLVVFFYGGSWTRGERADYRFVGEALASAGIATVVADYRLSPQVHWQDILRDCALATRWARDQAASLGARPDRLFVMGHSAGAYNAAMLALDARWLAAQGMKPAQLAGWIGLAGPYDFLPIGDPEVQVAFGWPGTPVDSQPLAHASGASPPALLLAPENDTVVNPRRSTAALARKLQDAGVPVRTQLYSQLNHATMVGSLARPLRFLAPVRQAVTGFVHGPAGPAG